MAESLFSPSWYRVESLRPRLRRHARVYRHAYRGDLWYVVQDPSSGRHHRLSPAAHAFVGLMDGDSTVGELWHAVSTRMGDEAPTQDDVIRLLGMLHTADLLQCDVTPDSLEMFRRFQRQRRARWKQQLMNPLSLQIPLLDPDRFLRRWLWLVRPLFGWAGVSAWVLVVGTALLMSGPHWTELTHDIVGRVLTPGNMALLWLTYPVLKVLHELGHAFATKVWGGEVHEMGIAFLVLVPLPYVDASSSSAFRDRRRRMVVGAAGMIVEVFIAALAFFVWLVVEPGLVRSIAHNLILIGAVSTLLFNGNPLLRFDGYYILADALDIPNLGKRSKVYLGYLVQRHLFGVRDATSPAVSTWERTWFVAYGISSFLYRIAIMIVIALFIGSRFFVVGIALALWVVATQIAVPAFKQLAFVMRSPVLRRTRARAVVATGAIALGVAVVVLALPLPSWTSAQGVVWLPEQSHVRAATDGFIRSVLVAADSAVAAGERLIETEDPFLDSRVRVLEARLRELRALHDSTWQANPAEAQRVGEELATVRADLDLALERAREAVIVSPVGGRFVPTSPDLIGRFVTQGELLGYVTDFSKATVRVVVPQADVARVRRRTRRIEVRLADRLWDVRQASIVRQVPEGTDRLPSAALGTQGGGSLEVDRSDEKGTLLLESAFQLDLALPRGAEIGRAGVRVYVRFDHGTETLAEQSYRSLRRLFMRRFGV
jgi:putative peptide zinc metalloprotease protein